MKENATKKIRKGDKVVAIAGNFRGMSGTVLSCSEDRVVVQGLNVRKRHMKKQGQQPGQILSIERPIHVSNVQLCSEDGKPVKVKVRTNGKGERELFYKDGSKEVVHRTVKQPAK